jgi:hypothetical protein
MNNKELIINFIYIENSFVYKSKDLLKNKQIKYIIDYKSVVDKSFNVSMKQINKDILIASLILKRLKKIITKNNFSSLNIYFILNSYDKSKIKNLNNIISNYYNGKIINNLYTDKKGVKDSFLNSINNLEAIKNDT